MAGPAGGLLSILRVQNQAFFFDIQSPRSPIFVKANTLPTLASIADAWATRSAGGYFTTFMGGAAGAAPGRVVEYDANNNPVGFWPAVPPLDGFNPHGIALDEAHNLLLTSDFVCPLHTPERGARRGQRRHPGAAAACGCGISPTAPSRRPSRSAIRTCPPAPWT